MSAPARGQTIAVMAILAGVAVVALVAGSSSGRHRVTVLAEEARFIRPGLEVRSAGQVIGTVVSAAPTRDGRARVVLQIDRSWPLPAGTTARFRWAGAIAFTNRYVELKRPVTTTSYIPDRGTIAGRDVTPTVEFDQVTQLFGRQTRQALRHTIDAGGRTLGPIRRPLRHALEAAPPALVQAQAVLADLGADRGALDTLVRSTDRVVHAIQTADPGTAELVSRTAETLTAIGGRSRALQRGLAAMPDTLDETRAGLRDADATLTAAGDVLGRLAPGVGELRRIAAPLRGVLASVVAVAPQATSTLRTLRRATRDVKPLLADARDLMPRLESVSRQALPQLNCIRPYTPEIAGFASTWTGFESRGDGKDKYARVTGALYPHELSASPANPKEWTQLFPGLKDSLFRAPGQVAGQPQYDAACGVGVDTADPANDPEAIG